MAFSKKILTNAKKYLVGSYQDHPEERPRPLPSTSLIDSYKSIFLIYQSIFSNPYALRNNFSDNMINIIHFYGAMTCLKTEQYTANIFVQKVYVAIFFIKVKNSN